MARSTARRSLCSPTAGKGHQEFVEITRDLFPHPDPPFLRAVFHLPFMTATIFARSDAILAKVRSPSVPLPINHLI